MEEKIFIFLTTVVTVVILNIAFKYKSDAESSRKELLELIRKSHRVKEVEKKEETAARKDVTVKDAAPDLKEYVNGKRLPNALIIGEMKGGTTALSAFLGSHPNISMATREINFFDLHFDEGFDWYREQMSQSTASQLVMEKSVYFGSVMEPCFRIKQYKPDIKMLLIIRDPVTRVISHFSMRYKNEKFFKTGTLEDFILQHDTGDINKYSDFINRGMYYQNMMNWNKCFNVKDIHIVDGEKFKTKPLEELKKIEKYLKIKPYYNAGNIYYSKEHGAFCYKDNGEKMCLPSWVSRSHRNISSITMKKLYDFYHPLNRQFMDLVKKEFPWK